MQTDADFISATINKKDSAIPQFFIKQVKNNFKSNQAGHAVYDAKEYVRVIIPGDRNSVPEREVREADKSRWAKHYLAFKNGLVMAPEGLPLEKWPLIDINQIEHLKHWNVRTVEQLAMLNDMHLQKLGMGARDLKSKAIVYLEQAKDASGVSRIVQENETLKTQLKEMQDQIDSLLATAASFKAAAEGTGAAPAISAQPAAPGLSAEAIQQMIAQGVAAALAAQPPKNKGGRPRKNPAPEHELTDEDAA